MVKHLSSVMVEKLSESISSLLPLDVYFLNNISEDEFNVALSGGFSVDDLPGVIIEPSPLELPCEVEQTSDQVKITIGDVRQDFTRVMGYVVVERATSRLISGDYLGSVKAAPGGKVTVVLPDPILAIMV